MSAQSAQLRAMFGPVVQRQLAHDRPIVAADVTAVKQLGGKLVFRLTGRGADEVIVKFETHGGSETTAEAEGRNEIIQILALAAIGNVPGMSQLTDGDIAEIQQLPEALGPAAGLLKRIVGDERARQDMLFLKKEKVEVGENLWKMVERDKEAKPVKVKRGEGLMGLGKSLPRSQQLLLDHGIARSMGRTAAFDLFVGSDDRFRANPEATNLENIDFSSAGGDLINLDQFDPNAPIQAARTWDGGGVLRDKSTRERYAVAVYNELFSTVGLPDPFFDAAVAASFLEGMEDAVARLRKKKGLLTHIATNPRVNVSAHHQAIAGVLLQRLAQIA